MSTSSPAVTFGLHHDAWGQLVLIDREGVRHVGVEPIRAFPYSDPRKWISLRNSDGVELVLVPDLDELPNGTRKVLEEELASREFVPIIQRIVKIWSATQPSKWDVETDRGPTSFILNADDDIRRLGPHRAMIIDAVGIRYLIPDSQALDHRSRWNLEKFL